MSLTHCWCDKSRIDALMKNASSTGDGVVISGIVRGQPPNEERAPERLRDPLRHDVTC
jgi:hypothetical protein